MKLGGAKAKAANGSSLADTLAGEWEEADEVANAWGTNDLIDVNADDDDWAGFESAPIPEVIVPPAQSYYHPPSQPNGKSSYQKPSPDPSPRKKSPVPAAVPTLSKPVFASPLSKSTSPASSSAPSFDEWADAEEAPSNAPSPQKGTVPMPGLAGMSKEEKDKEMARRREERKAVSRFTNS